MKISRCAYCGKPLVECKTLWAGMGKLFCSKDCGIDDAMTLYDDDDPYVTEDQRHGAAETYFNDIAEEVNLEDVGIEEETWTAYDSNADVTTIFRTMYENDEIASTAVIGFYFGQPEAELTESNMDSLVARFYTDEDK